MSLEADGSILYSLFWTLWMYWIFRCWVEQHSSIPRKDADKPPEDDALPGTVEAAAIRPDCIAQSPRTASFFADILAEIARRDSRFALDAFLQQTAAAYEQITLAFSAGDRATLRQLVSKEVYESFLAAIHEREGRHETEETSFVRIAPPVFESAVLIGDDAEITVRLTAELFRIRRDGAVVRGNSNIPLLTADLWTFARSLSARSRVWTLVATAKPAPTLTIDGKAYAQ